MDCCDIPKIIHVFEADGEESPHQINLRQLHPDWEIMQWSPLRIVELINNRLIVNTDLPDRHKLQIIKMETLVNFGGVWIDKGIELCQPLDDIIYNTNNLLLEDLVNEIDFRVLGFTKNHKTCWAWLQRIYPRVGEYLDDIDKAFDPSWIRELNEEKNACSLILPYRCIPYESDEEARNDFRGYLGERKNHVS